MAPDRQARPRLAGRCAADRGRGDAVGSVAAGALAFAATNLDDLLLLVAWFAAGRYRARDIVLGQYLGIGALFAASAAGSFVSLVVPPAWLSWLGLVPVALGLRMLLKNSSGEEAPSPATGILAVAALTIANGSDNLGVYLPRLAAPWLVGHPAAGVPLRRYGPRAVPYVLVAIGLWILAR